VASHIIVAAGLALLVFFTVVIYGFWKNGMRFLRVFVPSGIPMFILPLVVSRKCELFIMGVTLGEMHLAVLDSSEADRCASVRNTRAEPAVGSHFPQCAAGGHPLCGPAPRFGNANVSAWKTRTNKPQR
jgi:hypothetical protein